ncbi:MAG: sulfite exporter TauE/SafE family protein [Clostridiaceae bacterium]|nr:sulfite exporter TauE/SafE family protein [Clostridiaceae bacterium]
MISIKSSKKSNFNKKRYDKEFDKKYEKEYENKGNQNNPNNQSDKGGKKLIKKIVIGFITGIVNGLFGSGGGTIVVPAMVLLLDLDEHKAHATAISIILPLTIISTFFYVKNNYVDWNITWKVIIGGMAGGYIGAKLLNICPENFLRKVFGGFMVFAAIRMLWR